MLESRKRVDGEMEESLSSAFGGGRMKVAISASFSSLARDYPSILLLLYY